jgi:hypothetical protein
MSGSSLLFLVIVPELVAGYGQEEISLLAPAFVGVLLLVVLLLTFYFG